MRLLTAWPQQQPNYMDAAYYYVNAVNLAEGRGFVEDFLWNYLNNPNPPPQPSHLYWMPLTSMLAALSMAVGGISYHVAQIPFIILSALLPPLTYVIAYHLLQQQSYPPRLTRQLSLLAAMFMLTSGFYLPYWTAIDNFTPFGLFGALALMLASQWVSESANQLVSQSASQSVRQSWLLCFVTGLCIGLAHLSRADGPLLLIAIFLYIWFSRQPSAVSRQSPSFLTSHFSLLTPYFLILTSYLLLLTPWLIRNWQVTGTPFPVSGTQTIWLTQYDDLFSYGRELSAQTFWAQGLGSILQSRWWALTVNSQRVLAEWGMILLWPFILMGGWRGRKLPMVQLSSLYALLLFLTMTFIFTFPGVRGGLFHSATALLPFMYALAALGFSEAIDWLAARRRTWNAKIAKPIFGVGLLFLTSGLSGGIYYQRVLQNNTWNQADSRYPAVVTWLKAQNSQAIVMIGNPPAYRYHGGGLSVIVPNEPPDITIEVMRRYQVDYLILDVNCPAPLAQLYNLHDVPAMLKLVHTVGQDNQPIRIFAWR